MKEVYQVIAYDIYDGEDTGEVVASFDTLEEAEACQFQCEEGDDRHEPLEYIINATSIAE
jgi:hypothetical protein